MLKVPPVVGNSEGCFPKQADQQHEEKREAERAPVDEAPRHREKAYSRNQRAEHQKREISGKARLILRSGKVLLVKPRRANQDEGQNQRGGMKLQQPAHLLSFPGIVSDVVGSHPELADLLLYVWLGEKSSEIKNVFLDGNRFAEREGVDSQRRSSVGIVKEPLREDQVQHASQRNQNCNRPPERPPRNVQSLAGQEPHRDDDDGDDEK